MKKHDALNALAALAQDNRLDIFRLPLAKAKTRGIDVSIRHIQAANSVALYGSFTAAAADLGMTQSAASRLVLQLEKQLGVSLFLRSTRNVVLTAPGREFTASTRRLMEDATSRNVAGPGLPAPPGLKSRADRRSASDGYACLWRRRSRCRARARGAGRRARQHRSRARRTRVR
jgi:Bacterial regulatory helix-turn-helix protein, lysR family